MAGRPSKFEALDRAVTVIDTFAECDRLPLMPWIVTVYSAGETLPSTVMVSVDVPDPPLTEEVARDAVMPEVELVVSMTAPVNPLTEVIVIVDVAVPPALMEILVGLAVRV